MSHAAEEPVAKQYRVRHQVRRQTVEADEVARIIIWSVIGGGFALVVILALLRGHGETMRIEYWLALGWFWVRLTLCFVLSALIIVMIVSMGVTGKAPNGTSVGILELLVAAPICLLLVWYLVRVGLFGKVSRYSSLREDREDQVSRFRRHRTRDDRTIRSDRRDTAHRDA